MKFKTVLIAFCLIFALTGCQKSEEDFIESEENLAESEEDFMESEEESIETADISEGMLRKEVFALVSSAENSTTDYTGQYAYIEDIGDGRGYTAGIIEKEQAPSEGGDEEDYLMAFLDARVPVMQMEEAHSDLSRIDAQRKFLQEGKFNLELPLEWSMYGDQYFLSLDESESMK